MRRYRLWTEPLSHTSVTLAQQPIGRLRTLICSPSHGRRPPRTEDMQPTRPKFGNLTPEAQAARLLHCRYLGVVSVHRLATEMGLPVERAELLMCRRLATLIARGYPAEDLCETYNLTPEQLSGAATTPVFSNAFEPLAAGR